MLQRVFKVTTLCLDTRFQSFPPLVSGLIHHGLLQSCPRLNKPLLKMTFLTFPRYSSYSMWVRWANLQPSNVQFLQDSVSQKWLKSVHFLTVIQKNKNERFLGHIVFLSALLSSRPGLGLEDRWGYHLEVLALTSDDQVLALVMQVLVLALALKKRSWTRPWPGNYFVLGLGR